VHTLLSVSIGNQTLSFLQNEVYTEVLCSYAGKTVSWTYHRHSNHWHRQSVVKTWWLWWTGATCCGLLKRPYGGHSSASTSQSRLCLLARTLLMKVAPSESSSGEVQHAAESILCYMCCWLNVCNTSVWRRTDGHWVIVTCLCVKKSHITVLHVDVNMLQVADAGAGQLRNFTR